MIEDNIVALLDSITDDQAENSDIGGDSDADDNFDDVIDSTDKSVARNSSSSSNSTTPSLTPKSNVPPSRISPSSNLPDFQLPSTGFDKTIRNLPLRSATAKKSLNFNNVSGDNDASDVDDPDVCFSPIRPVHFSSSSDETDSEQQNKENDEFHWTKNEYKPFKFSNFKFNEKFGLNLNVDNTIMLNYFELFMTETFLNLIVTQSNLYASQKNQILDLTVTELKAVIGILIIMGFNILPSMSLYWSDDENFHNSRISNIMTVKRFLKIIRFIHLNDNDNMAPRGSFNFDKLYKIRPMIKHLNTRFPKIFSPSRYLAVDESVISFTGRTTMKQYMPLKTIKRGFKVWVIACSVTGYMLGFDIYTGKSAESDVNIDLGEKVVLSLTSALQGLGYCIFFNHFFSSIPLMQKLLTTFIFACATIRKNRIWYPTSSLQSDKTMRKGDLDYVQSNDISVTKWKGRGKNPVNVISNMHSGIERANVLRTNSKGIRESIPCSKSIYDYNAYVGGVDKFDQLLAACNISWKSRRWWLKIFYYMLGSCIVNSYICYKEDQKNKKVKYMFQLNFRSKLANELINNFCSRKRKMCTVSIGMGGKKLKFTENMCNVGDHLPIVGTYRRCAYCSIKQNQKRSNLLCKKCDKALCKKCFAPYHSRIMDTSI